MTFDLQPIDETDQEYEFARFRHQILVLYILDVDRRAFGRELRSESPVLQQPVTLVYVLFHVRSRLFVYPKQSSYKKLKSKIKEESLFKNISRNSERNERKLNTKVKHTPFKIITGYTTAHGKECVLTTLL